MTAVSHERRWVARKLSITVGELLSPKPPRYDKHDDYYSAISCVAFTFGASPRLAGITQI